MFEAQGQQPPPWRAYPATVARWLSSACVDVPVPMAAATTLVLAGKQQQQLPSSASSAAPSASVSPQRLAGGGRLQPVQVALARAKVDRFITSCRLVAGGVKAPLTATYTSDPPPPGAVSNRGVVCDVPAGGDRGGDSASQDQDGTVGRRRACALAPLGGAFPQPRSSHPTITTTAPLAFDAPCASSSVTSPRQQRTIEKVVVMGFNVKPTPAATALKGSGSCDGVLQSH